LPKILPASSLILLLLKLRYFKEILDVKAAAIIFAA